MTEPRTFILSGHRGNMADAPENTLAGFASAERVGADEIELDVRSTSDGVLIMLHDHTLARTAAAPSPYLDTPVEELTFDQVRSIDLGEGQRVPTFEETLDATSVLLQVEIKALSAARLLADFLKSRPLEDQNRCLMTSFDSLSLSEFADQWGDSIAGRGLGFHTHDVDSNWQDVIARLDLAMVLIPLGLLTRPLVDQLHEDGYLIAGSMLDNAGDARRIVELNVDTSASNMPAYGRELLSANADFAARFPQFVRSSVTA